MSSATAPDSPARGQSKGCYWAAGCVGAAIILALGFVWLAVESTRSTFRMDDSIWQVARSPDGQYVATLYYKDGLTYGYYHVTLEARGGSARSDVIEVAAEGLGPLSWQGNRTLVVDYDAARNKDPLEDTCFVTAPGKWRDVRILYHGVGGPTPSSTATPPPCR